MARSGSCAARCGYSRLRSAATRPEHAPRRTAGHSCRRGRMAAAAVSQQLRVNPIACSGHGLCAELLPELITLDEWGYPVLDGRPVPPGLDRAARRAAASCPALALLLSPAP